MNDTQAWLQVPDNVRTLFVKYAATARDVVKDSDDPSDWVFDTPEVGEVRIMKAAMLSPLRRVSEGAQGAFGGPNPLTATLLGGSLGALLGYGGGKLLHRFAPEYFEEDLATKFGLPLGLGLGAGVPLLAHGIPMHMIHGPKGWLMRSYLQGGKAPLPQGVEPPSWLKNYTPPTAAPPSKTTQADSVLSDAIDHVSAAFNVEFEKDAAFEVTARAGLMHVPDVQTDAWGKVVAPDPYMDPPTKALVAGLPAAAGASRGSSWVSPADVGRVAANAGLGWGMGKAIGMIAGPMLRLTPKARNDIQNAGLFAGMFKSLGFL